MIQLRYACAIPEPGGEGAVVTGGSQTRQLVTRYSEAGGIARPQYRSCAGTVYRGGRRSCRTCWRGGRSTAARASPTRPGWRCWWWPAAGPAPTTSPPPNSCWAVRPPPGSRPPPSPRPSPGCRWTQTSNQQASRLTQTPLANTTKIWN